MKKIDLNSLALALTLLAWVPAFIARRPGAAVVTRTLWTERQCYGGWGSICCAKEKASGSIFHSLRNTMGG